MYHLSAAIGPRRRPSLAQQHVSFLLLLVSAGALLLTAAPGARAQSSSPTATLNNLVSFSSIAGVSPQSAPIQGTDGALYGVNSQGGIYNLGSIYRRTASGSLITLHSFGPINPATGEPDDGETPFGALVQAPDGFFYGTCFKGGASGAGTVFKIAADGTGFTILHTFNTGDGATPYAALTVGQDGYLYGTTQNSGATGAGTIFLLSTDGTTFVDLHDFQAAAEGSVSQTPLRQDTNGIFYGTLGQQGTGGSGAVFSLTVSGVGANATGALHILYAFGGVGKGFAPAGNLVLDSGVLYGTAEGGGANQHGAIFSVPTANAPVGATVSDPLYSFTGGNDGSLPVGGLTLVNGKLYGTGSLGTNGDGSVFSVTESGSLTVLHIFTGTPDGNNPLSALTLAADGTTLYGTTQLGGTASLGTLFQISANGTGYQTLLSFFYNQQTPYGSLIQGADGAFYGTDSVGGAYGQGTVFRVDSSSRALTTLHQFGKGADGQQPQAALVMGAGGYFYGTTQGGGANGQGSVFRILPDGTGYSVTHSFASYGGGPNNADGAVPLGSLVQSTDGFLYGAAQVGGANDYGTIFQISPDGTTFNVLHSFNRSVDGAFPVTALVQDANGLLYGTTRRGGNSDNDGTIFRLATDGTGFMTLRTLTLNTDGANPAGTLVLDPATGLLYGTTEIGRTNANGGTVFQIAEDGTGFTVLADLPAGSFSESGLLLSHDGFLYGTTSGGGINSVGTIYRLSTAGALSMLYDFSKDGTASGANGSAAGLFEGSDGFLYGTSDAGGFSNQGSVYQVAVTPVINGGTISGHVGTFLSVAVPADHNPTAYAAANLPAGLSINSSIGVISGTPTAIGSSIATVTVSNALGSDSANFTVTILVPAPVVTSGAPTAGQVGVPYAYQFAASNTPTAYAATGLPAGLAIDADTGAVSGTPTVEGSFSVMFSASNAGGTASATYTLTILPAVPVISGATSASTQAGVAFTYQIGASHSPTSYGASGLPVGLAADTSTGLISGTPTTAGTYPVGLAASNAGGTGTATLTLTVTPAAVITPAPVINSAPTATATAGQAFSYLITASNGATSFSSSALPAGLALQAATGLISGTPTSAGTFALTLRATNATGTGAATLTLTVTAAAKAPTIGSAAAASGRIGVPFTYQIAAANSPLSFAATGLPAGLSVNSAGLISGTPTAAGTFVVSLHATNAAGTGTGTLTLTISAAVSEAPVITSASSRAGRVDVEFAYQITATNAPKSLSATDLPEGLTVTNAGLISGKPAKTGTFKILLAAANANGKGTATLTLTVARAPLPVITLRAAVPEIHAGSGNDGVFTLSRTGDLSQELTVAYMVEGTAIAGTDYMRLTGVRKLAAGMKTATIKVIPVGDGGGKGVTRTVVLLLESRPDHYTVGTANKVHVKIIGD